MDSPIKARHPRLGKIVGLALLTFSLGLLGEYTLSFIFTPLVYLSRFLLVVGIVVFFASGVLYSALLLKDILLRWQQR